MIKHSSFWYRQLPGILASVIVACFCAGCSSSSPRYRSGETPSAVVQEDDEFRFAPRIKEEESREDDKKVDLAKVKKDLVSKSPSSSHYRNLTPVGINRDQVLLTLVSYLGVPYAFGGSTKRGIDCSAFTSQVYAGAVNTSLPRSTAEQFERGKEVSKDDLQFGDLVFFNTTGRTPSHVGIYIEDDLFAHASVSYGVTISSLESKYYRDRFVGARRFVQ